MFQTDFEKEIETYYRGIYGLIIDKELDGLRSLLADEFIFTSMDGDQKDRESFIGDIEEEALKVYSENIERMYIDACGDRLRVRGRSKINVSSGGSRRRIRRVQVDLELRKTEGGDDPSDTKWQVLSAKVSYY